MLEDSRIVTVLTKKRIVTWPQVDHQPFVVWIPALTQGPLSYQIETITKQTTIRVCDVGCAERRTGIELLSPTLS